jgi:hypothetical protein
VKALSGEYAGRVVAHAAYIQMTGVSFHVSASGQARARREKQRNVHAGIIGYVVAIGSYETRLPNDIDVNRYIPSSGTNLVTYNPWKYDTFVMKETGEPVHSATDVTIWSDLVSITRF